MGPKALALRSQSSISTAQQGSNVAQIAAKHNGNIPPTTGIRIPHSRGGPEHQNVAKFKTLTVFNVEEGKALDTALASRQGAAQPQQKRRALIQLFPQSLPMCAEPRTYFNFSGHRHPRYSHHFTNIV